MQKVLLLVAPSKNILIDIKFSQVYFFTYRNQNKECPMSLFKFYLFIFSSFFSHLIGNSKMPRIIEYNIISRGSIVTEPLLNTAVLNVGAPAELWSLHPVCAAKPLLEFSKLKLYGRVRNKINNMKQYKTA